MLDTNSIYDVLPCRNPSCKLPTLILTCISGSVPTTFCIPLPRWAKPAHRNSGTAIEMIFITSLKCSSIFQTLLLVQARSCMRRAHIPRRNCAGSRIVFSRMATSCAVMTHKWQSLFRQSGGPSGVGPKGTIIFADTRGHHKGVGPRARPGIMYTCMFTSPLASELFKRARRNIPPA